MPDAVTLKDDFIFLVSDHSGDVISTPEGHGMYLHDTRYLSRLELFVDDARPEHLSYTTDYNIGATFRLGAPFVGLRERAGDLIREPVGSAIGIARRRYIQQGLVESLEFTNYYPEDVDVMAMIKLGADFLDMFEVRGMPRLVPGHVVSIETSRAELGTKVVFRSRPLKSNQRGGAHTMLFLCDAAPENWEEVKEPNRVTGMPMPEILLHYKLRIAPHQTIVLHLRAMPEPVDEGKTTVTRKGAMPKTSFRQQVAAARRVFTEWEQACTRITTDSYVLNRILETSMLDLRSLMQQEPQGLVVTAGLPWYFTLFGRDSIITALQTLMLNPQIAVDTLRALAAYQATEVDDWRDSEPGKILHELRRGDMALAGEVPHSPYYGSVDSTLLYMMLFAETLKWTDSQELFDELWSSVRKALDWAWQWGDADGDGYIEFSARSSRGIRHQGWKDSDESLGGTMGPRPRAPIALVEVQGYYYAALVGVAEALRRYGGRVEEQAKGALGDKLEKQAADLKAQFNRDFWSDATGFYVHALDGSKAQVPDVTSNVGHCLWTGIIDGERAAQVVAKFMQPDMLSGWGVRTVSANDVTYNPMSYHNGSIWPHDNAILVAGLRRYGFGAEMVRVGSEILDAAATFEVYRLPELYCGFPRGEGIEQESAPAAYPVSCSPQAWAAGSSIMILQALLGAHVEPGSATITTSPVLPDGVTSVRLHDLKVAGSLLDVSVTSDDAQSPDRSSKTKVSEGSLVLAGRSPNNEEQ
jgi:glycogen debranching enzyme